jgi:hypothetical protein
MSAAGVRHLIGGQQNAHAGGQIGFVTIVNGRKFQDDQPLVAAYTGDIEQRGHPAVRRYEGDAAELSELLGGAGLRGDFQFTSQSVCPVHFPDQPEGVGGEIIRHGHGGGRLTP